MRYLAGFFFAVISVGFFSTISLSQQETAFYELDRSSDRTTGMVRDGALQVNVSDYIPDHEDGPAYRSNFDFELETSIAGRQRGHETIMLVEQYFSEEFWQELCQNKSIETPSFKVDHLAIENVTIGSGQFFEGCDKVLFYDIQTEGSSFLFSFFNSLTGYESKGLDDMKFTAYICDDVPAWGAAKLDITGKSRGFRFKLGFDYKP